MKTLLLLLTMLMISSLSFGQLTFRELKKAIDKKNQKAASTEQSIQAPAISSITTDTVKKSVTIMGTNFTGATVVSFEGKPATTFQIISPTKIIAYFDKLTKGKVKVTNPAGISSISSDSQLNNPNLTDNQQQLVNTAPIISNIDPIKAGKNVKITIKGNNFNGVTKVTFGGTPATTFQVVSPTSIIALVGTGESGDVNVVNSSGTGTLAGGFTYDPNNSNTTPPVSDFTSPIISKIEPVSASKGDKITITGYNFSGASEVSFGGIPADNVKIISPTSIVAVIGEGATGDVVVANTSGIGTLAAGFTFNSGSTNVPQANTDFTLPDVGQKKLNLIFTPTFKYNKLYSNNTKYGVTGTFWGNSLGTDSSIQTIGTKFLIPQASMIGTKIDIAFILFDSKTDDIKVGPVGEVNLLWKKVSYIDTNKADAAAGKLSSANFTPFVIHSKLGFTLGFFDANITVTGYLNYLWVTTENNNFSKLFKTNKSFLTYPELNTIMAFYLDDSSKQTIKVGIDMIYNNSDAQILSNSHDKIIPYLKIGFASSF